MRSTAFATLILLTLTALCPTAAWTAERTVLTVPSSAGEKALQEAIVRLGRSGGGRIELEAAVYELRRGLVFEDVAGLTLSGKPGSTLVLAPAAVAVLTQDAVRGDKVLHVEDTAGLAPGMHCEIQAPGHGYESPDGRKHVCPYFGFTIAAIDGRQITPSGPLAYAAAKGTKLIHVYNALTIRGRSANLVFENFTIDMARDRWPIAPLNHTEHCAVYAATRFDYEKGLLAPPIERLAIRNCTLRNAHHRGVAWYGVTGSTVTGCRLEKLGDEAIDLDHFCRQCRVLDNQISQTPVGIELNDASDCLVQGNRVEQCQKGINLWRWCAGDTLNVDNVFRDNRLSRCATVAIFCGAKTTRSQIVGNQIEGPGAKGIHIAGTGHRLEGNTVRGCTAEGIFLTGSNNSLQSNRCEACGTPLRDAGQGNQHPF